MPRSISLGSLTWLSVLIFAVVFEWCLRGFLRAIGPGTVFLLGTIATGMINHRWPKNGYIVWSGAVMLAAAVYVFVRAVSA